MRKALIFFTFCLVIAGCMPPNPSFSPKVENKPSSRQITLLNSPFPKLSERERQEDWGKEYTIAIALGKEFDFYRAITGFKRALILLPQKSKENRDRNLQIQYHMILSYYLAQKYPETILTFEESNLVDVKASFPAFQDLLVILSDAYDRLEEPEKAQKVKNLLEKTSEPTAKKLTFAKAVRTGDISTIEAMTPDEHRVHDTLGIYHARKKSVRRAKTLNTLLPGTGYAYVGQKKSAITSFLINTLFAAATYQLFDRGHFALGAIVGSLEIGWYLGGIHGAGIAANEYNERLYEPLGTRILKEEGLLPIAIIEYAF